MQSPLKHPLRLTALLCLLVGFLSILPLLHGGLLYYGDYYMQYLPFLQETRRMLLSGSFAWSWNTFLGDGFFGAYSYYTATNPFAYLALLFPDSLLLYGTLTAQLVKYVVAGLTSFLYLRLFVKKDSSAVLGALLYTFSGFTIINTSYYFFLDVIAVFPLLLLGIELVNRYHDRRSDALLALSVFVNAIVNYYFLISSALLCLIYIVIRFELWRRPQGGLRLFGRLAASALFGLGLSGFLLLPSFWKILHTPKAATSLGTLHFRPYSLGNLLERLRIFFMPIEHNIRHAFYLSGSWTSTAVYLSVFGVLFVLIFISVNRKHWLVKNLAVLFVFLMVPLLNSTFTLFSDYSYTRWLYGFVLLLDLATVLVFDQREFFLKSTLRRWYKIGLCCMLVLSVPPALVCTLEYFGISTPLHVIYNIALSTIYTGMRGIALSFGMTAVNYLLLGLIVYHPRMRIERVIAAVCVASIVNYSCFLMFYRSLSASALKENFIPSSLPVSSDTSYAYRSDYSSANANTSLFCNTPSVSGYHSLQNEQADTFAIAAGYTDTPAAVTLKRPAQDSGVLDTLLSVRYYTDCGDNPAAQVPEGFVLRSEQDGIAVYENENYLPFGFCYSSYLTQSESQDSKLSPAELMLSTLIVADESEQRVAELLPKAEDLTTFDLSDTAAQRRTQCTSSFSGTSSGFTAAIDLEQDNYVFFSVPNDPGWSAAVNGQSAEIVTAQYGLCAVRCAAGHNDITFTYHTPLLRAGCIVSILSLLGGLLLVFAPYKKRRAR